MWVYCMSTLIMSILQDVFLKGILNNQSINISHSNGNVYYMGMCIYIYGNK